MINKLKKRSKILLFFYFITMLGYIISLLFFTKSIISLSGIETTIRYLALSLFWILFILYFFGAASFIIRRKKSLFWLITVLLITLIPIFSLCSFYINKTYNKIDTINKDYVSYTSNLVILKDTNFKNIATTKVGMIADKKDMEGNILAKKLIKKERLNKVSVIEYNTYHELITALYNKEVSAIFLSSNYVAMFDDDEEGFPNIEYDTKVIKSYTEKTVKDEDASSKKLTEPFSILLVGVDSTSEKLKESQSFNGDTLMLITFNPQTLNVTMFSIPRDTYVPIVCQKNREAKVNTAAYGGTSCVVKTIENFTDIDIDYYVKINFKGVVNLVDALGGITVKVPKDLCEQDSERRWGKNTICIKKGIQHLNGEETLAFARNRHAFVRADFDRVQNQQLIVEALIKEAKNIRSVKAFYKILDAVSNNVDTNMKTKEMLSFYNVGKDMLINVLTTNNNVLNIQKTELSGYSLTINNSYTFQYYKQSIKQISDAMKINMGLKKPTMIKTFTFSVNEPYKATVIGTKVSGDTRRATVPNFVNQPKNILETWASANNVTVTYSNVTNESNLFDETLADGTIITQSIRAGALAEGVTNIICGIITK